MYKKVTYSVLKYSNKNFLYDHSHMLLGIGSLHTNKHHSHITNMLNIRKKYYTFGLASLRVSLAISSLIFKIKLNIYILLNSYHIVTDSVIRVTVSPRK